MLYAFEHAGPEDRDRLAELAALATPTRTTSARSSPSSTAPAPRTTPGTQARRQRDEALAELDGMGVGDDVAREKLRGIILSVITA